MLFQIPELGLVLIGNQVGRVGILSMTRWEEQKQSGYRIEAILPLKEEEERGIRPRKALLGMAVGPVQGMERKGASRWRLLMYYCDHTILSYEISRPEEQGVLVV